MTLLPEDESDWTAAQWEQQKAVDQGVRALESLDRDPLRQPRLPWQSVHDLTWEFMPGQWWVLAAHTGRGKTTLAMNILSDLAKQGRQVAMLALEQSPEDMRKTWAAVSLSYKVSAVLAGKWELLPPRAKQDVADHISHQFSEGMRGVRFVEERFLNPATLGATIEAQANLGAELIIIDHLHRIADASYSGVSLAAKALSEAARLTQVPILCTAQLGMGQERDPLKPFLPPQIEDIYGSGVVAQECWVALGVYWPLGIHTKDDLAAVRRREKEPHELAIQNTLAVRVMKHRVRGGEVLGRTVTLRYEGGRIIDPETERLEHQERLESDFTRPIDDEPPIYEQGDAWEAP